MTHKLVASFTVVQICVLISFVGIWLAVPNSELFEKHYLNAVLDANVNLDKTYGQKRIILLGGSSLGFAVSAKKMSEAIGMPVINLGVNAAIGYKDMWRFHEKRLDPKNDIIVISPEYALFSIYNYVEQSCEVIALSRDIKLLLQRPHCFQKTMQMAMRNGKDYFKKKPFNAGIYVRNSFNEYGDVVAHYHDKGDIVKLDNSYHQIGVELLNNYINYIEDNVRSRGFKVIYIPTVVSKSFCRTRLQELQSIQRIMVDTFGGSPSLDENNLCYSDQLFYDSDYHMNYMGVQKKTALFLKQIQSVLSQK